MANDIEITKHIFVPKHRILDEKETTEVLKKFNIKRSQMPRIYIVDPALVNLGAKPGDVVHIERRSSLHGTSDFYRVVVE